LAPPSQHPRHFGAAYLFQPVIHSSIMHEATQRFLQLMVMLLMSYVGLIIGANKGGSVESGTLGRNFRGREARRRAFQNTDTSVNY